MVISGVENGDASLLFLSPEILAKKESQALLTSTIYRDRVCLLCIDEAHCVVQW